MPGPLMVDIEGFELGADDREVLGDPVVGGVIFFARNFHDRAQMTALAASIRELRPDLLLAVDQEGGRVQRFREGFTTFPPMALLGRALSEDPVGGAVLVRDSGWLLAAEVIATGLDFSFAPVLDIDKSRCQVIADRAFGDDPALVTRAARLFIAGMHDAGMAATGKHFPGHGGVRGDSHLETPRDGRGLEELERRDMVPFAGLAGELDGIMPAHIEFPRVDPHCVGFSRRWLQDILRSQLGFEGVIFSDDLSMKGADVAGGYRDKARAALAAGCDMILVCNNRPGALEVISELSASRVAASERLGKMAARRAWEWHALESDSRRLAVQERLEALQAKN